ncbi:MAG: DUF4410 domain-containing protein [Deltaproteobacteria bacterium]|nr:DUF4410 domain-containing protein [Deltaproteobacteria bacterium]
MKTPIGMLATALFIALLAGCGASVKAPRAPDGGPTKVQVLVDMGYTGKTPDEANQLKQVEDYLKPDLMNRLTDVGYSAEYIAAKEQFTPGPGKYLLVVTVLNYNPGSKAARMLVGFGAGSAALDERFDLFADGTTALLTQDNGRASSKDWTDICRRTNKDMVVAITNKLNGQ